MKPIELYEEIEKIAAIHFPGKPLQRAAFITGYLMALGVDNITNKKSKS